MTRMRLVLLALSLTSLVMGGCASTPSAFKHAQPLPEDFNVRDYRYLDVSVDAKEGVSMASYEKERLTMKLIEKVKTLDTVEFIGFNVPDSLEDTLSLEVMITRYDRGNAFARAMLAGLGQIHVDGDIVLRDKAADEILERGTVSKTFAWGGMYGAFTHIEDVEQGFAGGVIEALQDSKAKRQTARAQKSQDVIGQVHD